MFFKLSYLTSNLALTLGNLNPALNNSAQRYIDYGRHLESNRKTKGGGVLFYRYLYFVVNQIKLQSYIF